MSAEKQPACPVCSNPATKSAKNFPFCSDQCRLVDLGKWFGEEYHLPAPITERDMDHLIQAMSELNDNRQ